MLMLLLLLLFRPTVLRYYGFRGMYHLPYNPELSPFDLLKKHVICKRFTTDADVKQSAAFSWLNTLDTSLKCAGTQALMSRRDKCLIVSVDYIEVLGSAPSSHVPWYINDKVKFSTTKCLLLLPMILFRTRIRDVYGR